MQNTEQTTEAGNYVLEPLRPFQAKTPTTVGELWNLLVSVCRHSYGRINVRLRSPDTTEYAQLLKQLQAAGGTRPGEETLDASTQEQARRLIEIFTAAVDAELRGTSPVLTGTAIEAEVAVGAVIPTTLGALRDLLLNENGSRPKESTAGGELAGLRQRLARYLYGHGALQDGGAKWESPLDGTIAQAAAEYVRGKTRLAARTAMANGVT